ncbi:MAG: protein kinase domain-containing protein [Longimicrobiaceae bacterium]
MAFDETEIPAGLYGLEAEYEILGELGRGGMAVVYLARDRALRREVAIKVIRARYIEDEEALARFAREARTVAKLQHPGIVSVHSVHKLGAKGVALVMQYVPGRTLKAALREDGPFAPTRAQQVLQDIAEALGYAHGRGVVHRDIKPENIFLDERTGRALLSDFGIALTLESETQLTLAGTAIGTPTYMSPEQVDGEEVDGRSDLYSLGLVGWEMLSGRRPWDGEGLYSIIYKQKHEELPRVRALRPDVPARIAFAIEGALHKDREQRWQSAEAFAEQLLERTLAAKQRRWRGALRPAPAAVISGTPPAEGDGLDEATVRYRRPHAGATVPPQAAPKQQRARRVVQAAGALLLVVMSAALVYAISSQNQPPPRAPTAERSPPPALAAADLPAETGLPPFDSGAAPDDAPLADEMLSAPGFGEQFEPATWPAAGASAAASPPGASESPRIAAAPEAGRSAGAAPPSSPPPPSEPAPTRGTSAVVAGGGHSCVLESEGSVYCWGSNDRGQLGNRGTQRHATPVKIASDERFSALAAGVAHSCALTSAGSVYCWGANDAGQLGDGSTATRSVPTRVAGDLRLQRLWTGSAHSCGISRGGEAFCWGRNSNGQLGDGSTTDRSTPVRVSGAPPFSSLTAGSLHSCGLARSGEAYCWGRNSYGQLGDGSTTDRATPVRVQAETRFTSIHAVGAHTCGTTTRGESLCWGYNVEGQLGDGTRSNRTRPVPVAIPNI